LSPLSSDDEAFRGIGPSLCLPPLPLDLSRVSSYRGILPRSADFFRLERLAAFAGTPLSDVVQHPILGAGLVFLSFLFFLCLWLWNGSLFFPRDPGNSITPASQSPFQDEICVLFFDFREPPFIFFFRFNQTGINFQSGSFLRGVRPSFPQVRRKHYTIFLSDIVVWLLDERHV